MPNPSFNGARVLILESRRAKEMASIVGSYGGLAISAPSMREIPLESNTVAADAADALMRDEFDLVILLTGVGTRAWLDVVDKLRDAREPFIAALRRQQILCRGPKPVAVLRELNVPIWGTAAEPNTWHEVLALLDDRLPARVGPGAANGTPTVTGRRVAVQEYGASNPELLAGLAERGAIVTRVPVYQWGLPEDLGPLRQGIGALIRGEVDIALFTTATQVVHLLRVSRKDGQDEAVRRQLGRICIASIGPTTTEELRRQGIEPTLEASHAKMGFLVREAAEYQGREG